MIKVVDARRMPGPAAVNVLAVPLDLDTAPKTIGPFGVIGHHRMPSIPAGALPVDADVRPHPHIGLVALTYVLEGAITHRDSLGNRRELVAGDLGVTVAGRGVVHSERFERIRLLGGTLDMFQLLLPMPDGHEEVAPSFFCTSAAEMASTRDGGATTRWLVAAPPALPGGIPTSTPVLLADVALEAGATWTFPDVPQRGLYVWAGEVRIGESRASVGQVAEVGPGEHAVTASADARFLAFGGTPPGPRFSWWNYMHSSLDAIEAAKAAWRAGSVALPPGDTESFTPAPADDGRPLRRLNADGA